MKNSWNQLISMFAAFAVASVICNVGLRWLRKQGEFRKQDSSEEIRNPAQIRSYQIQLLSVAGGAFGAMVLTAGFLVVSMRTPLFIDHPWEIATLSGCWHSPNSAISVGPTGSRGLVVYLVWRSRALLPRVQYCPCSCRRLLVPPKEWHFSFC